MSNPGSLRPGWQPGQSGNPSGANAITKALAEFRKFMAEATSTGHTRLYNVWNRLYLGAVNGNFIAGKFIVEQCQGKAREFMDKVLPPDEKAAGGGMLDQVLAVYRDRLLAGDLGEGELATLATLLMSAEKAEAEIIARILGDRKGVSAALKERAEAVIAKLESRTAEALPAAEPAPSEEKPCP